MNVTFSSTPLTPARLRAAWADQIAQIKPTHALTLACNQTIPLDGLRLALRRFFGHLDRELLGRLFHKQPTSRRTAYAAVPEHLTSNSHVHAVIRVTPARRARVEYLLGSDRSWLWSKVMPTGTHRLVSLPNGGWHAYCLKFHNLDGEVILAT
jgi:hypothetical protein